MKYKILKLNAQCSMQNVQLSMYNAQLSIQNVQLSMFNYTFIVHCRFLIVHYLKKRETVKTISLFYI